MINLILKSFTVLVFLIMLSNCRKSESKQLNYKKSLNSHKEIDKQNICDIIDSLARKASSMPYDTYRGTPFLKKKKSTINEKIVYHFYEDYPEQDSEGFYNGGSSNLTFILVKNNTNKSLVISSKKDTLKVDLKTIDKIVNGYYVIDLYKFFEYPFFVDKIDFKISSYKIDEPILIGTYWGDLNLDYSNSLDCKNVDFSNW